MKKTVIFTLIFVFFAYLSYSAFGFELTVNPKSINLDNPGTLSIEFVTLGGEPDTTKHVMLKPTMLIGNPFPISLENAGGQWIGTKYVVIFPLGGLDQPTKDSLYGGSLEFYAKDVSGNTAYSTILLSGNAQNTQDTQTGTTTNSESG